ncbi:MAG: hypothetical protein CK424_06225 [Legionella sp.]|nr:MAG: hypothetical protein CK424_06225 [Legionella sp.]
MAHATSILKSLNKNKGYYTLESLLDTVSTATDSFVIVGHHLYRPGKWINHIEEKSHLLDAIELPAKDIVQKEKYRNLSTSLKKNFVAGSDAHTWAQIGVGYTMCSDDVFGFSMFKNAIKTNKVSISISPEAEQLVQISSAYRKHLIS